MLNINLVSGANKLSFNFSIATSTSVIAVAEKSNSKNTLTLLNYGVSKSGEASCGAQGKFLRNIIFIPAKSHLLSVKLTHVKSDSRSHAHIMTIAKLDVSHA